MPPVNDEMPEKLRVDKWLWYARFFKTRGLAARLAGSGRLRVNGEHAVKPAHMVRPGDVLTFPLGRRIRVVRIVALGWRRGPAPEAETLYTDLDPAVPTPSDTDAPVASRESGTGRPTKKERRKIDALRQDLP